MHCRNCCPPAACLRADSLLRLQSEACSCVMQEMCKQCGRPGTVWEVLLADKSTDWKVVVARVGLPMQMSACDRRIFLLRLEIAQDEMVPAALNPQEGGGSGGKGETCRL